MKKMDFKKVPRIFFHEKKRATPLDLNNSIALKDIDERIVDHENLESNSGLEEEYLGDVQKVIGCEDDDEYGADDDLSSLVFHSTSLRVPHGRRR